MLQITSEILGNGSEEELLTYDRERKGEYDYLASIDQKFRESKPEGMTEVALNMLKAGLSKDIIPQVTGLSIDAINKSV